MPNYGYKCRVCTNEWESLVDINKRDIQICDCGAPAKRTFATNGLIIDKTLGYYDIQLGSYIGSSSDRRTVMNRLGVVDIKLEQGMVKRKSVDASAKLKKYTELTADAYRRHRGY